MSSPVQGCGWRYELAWLSCYVAAGPAADASQHARAQDAGALRPDVSPADITLILEMISFVDLPGPDRGRALRHRYLALNLEALRAPGASELLGQPASEADLTARWRPRTRG